MDFSLLSDGRLLFIVVLAGTVSMLTTLNVAARPAAVRTRQVALALAVSAIFFMCTRFANLFYLPILATYVDKAVRTGAVDILYSQIQWVIVGSALGALFSWLLLPTFSAIYERGIAGMRTRGSMFRVLLALPTPRGIRALFTCIRNPWELVSWIKSPSSNSSMCSKHDSPPVSDNDASTTIEPPSRPIAWDFLCWNVFATAIWTVGALCALYVSAIIPKFEATAVLLSGLVNSFAAIAFAIFVDPKAAIITDEAAKGTRSAHDVHRMSFHLGLGNFAGGMLGLATFPVGIEMIKWATLELGRTQLAESMWLVIVLNVIVSCLMVTTLSSRVAAVVTRSVATSLAIYNVFFLVTRLTTQVYAPVLGAVRDSVVNGSATASELLPLFRLVVLGATVGTLIGWLLLPTFVAIYNRAITALEHRHGSMGLLLRDLCLPRHWKAVAACLRRPSNLGISKQDILALPRGFLIANTLVVALHVIGVLAAILAGANLSGSLARTATLLSSVINGLATVLGSIIVDPTAAHLTDQAVAESRPLSHIKAMTVMLAAGSLLGTILSQVFFVPAAKLVEYGAIFLDFVFHYF